MAEKQSQEKAEVLQVAADAGTDTKKKEEETKGGFNAYWRIFTFSDRVDWLLFGLGFIAAVASGTALALVNVVFGGFVTGVTDFALGRSSKDDFLGKVNQFALYYVYLAIARFVLTYTYTVSTNVASTRITRNIRQKYLEATLSQEIGYFDQGQGSVSIAISTNGNLIQTGTSEKLGLSVQALSAFVSSFIVAFVVQWKLTLITLCIAPGIIIVVGIVVSIDAKWETKILDIYAQAGAFAEDVFGSMRTVHAFWARPTLVDKYSTYLDAAHAIGKRKSPIYGIMFSTEFFMVYAGFALAFWQGIHMYARGEIQDSGTVATVLFSVVVAATSLTQLAPAALPITNAASAAATLFKAIDRQSKINPFQASGKQPATVQGELEFSHVKFAYPTRPDVTVLEDFTLKVPANKVTAFVGASGSGKSTVVGLCERWYDPDSGTIVVDGVPIRELNPRWLRTKIRMVQQEPVLFNGTVFENVRNGLVATEHENASVDVQLKIVESACKLANAHDFISELPEGYHTQVGERASMLSGGQKQRIAIARSIVSEPAILLLDEATSALDPHAERTVQAALDKASKNRTTIVIAHKLATIKNADNIVVISKGRIVEQGTHDQLLDADGMYARLVKIQNLGTAAEASLQKTETENPKDLDLRTTLTRYATDDLKRMELQKDRDNYENHKQIGIVKAVWKLLREQPNLRFSYFMMAVACTIGGGVFPAQALLFAELQNVFLLTGPELTRRGDFFSLMFFIVAIANFLCYFTVGWQANLIVQGMTRRYRRQMFDSMLKQDLQFFDRPENTSGSLTSKLSSQPTAIQEMMGFQLGLIIIIFVNLVSSCSLALAYGWKLGVVVVFAGLPPLVASGYIRFVLEQKMEKDNSKRYSDAASMAGEAVGAIRTVNSLALEPQILARYTSELRHVVRRTTIATLHTMAWFALTQSIEFLFLALGFWYGCRLVANGEYTLQQFYIVFIGVFFAGQSASQFFSFSVSMSKAQTGANYIFWIRDLQPTIFETPENKDQSPPNNAERVALENVRFSYPLRPDAQVLRRVSLDIEPGQFVALVGASGCGKTTIVALLERFYDPVSGRITIDDTANITGLSPRLYRQHLSLVQQEPALYAGTIRENIGLGRRTKDEIVDKEKDENAVNTALRQANAYDFVSSLPEGIDTQVGRSGIQLSGGQRQRIAIARALIRNPDVLLLDEATSALDTESEKMVQAALAEAAQGQRITLAVAHRLSTIKDADKICVFMGGKIVETGKHQELLDQGGMYAQMCKAQSLDRAV